MTFWDVVNAHAEGVAMLIFGCVFTVCFFAYLVRIVRGAP